MNMDIDFTTITACGECCTGCRKKQRESAKAVLNPMGIVRSGYNR